MAALQKYLSTFRLESILKLSRFFTPFASRLHMHLSANALASLEIYQNVTDGKEYGSLLWVVDHTKTKFGGRLLKKWLGRPLVDMDTLQSRIEAVEECIQLVRNEDQVMKKMKGLLCQLPDLEKAISRVHYGRVSGALWRRFGINLPGRLNLREVNVVQSLRAQQLIAGL